MKSKERLSFTPVCCETFKDCKKCTTGKKCFKLAKNMKSDILDIMTKYDLSKVYVFSGCVEFVIERNLNDFGGICLE